MHGSAAAEWLWCRVATQARQARVSGVITSKHFQPVVLAGEPSYADITRNVLELHWMVDRVCFQHINTFYHSALFCLFIYLYTFTHILLHFYVLKLEIYCHNRLFVYYFLHCPVNPSVILDNFVYAMT